MKCNFSIAIFGALSSNKKSKTTRHCIVINQNLFSSVEILNFCNFQNLKKNPHNAIFFLNFQKKKPKSEATPPTPSTKYVPKHNHVISNYKNKGGGGGKSGAYIFLSVQDHTTQQLAKADLVTWSILRFWWILIPFSILHEPLEKNFRNASIKARYDALNIKCYVALML